MRTLSILLVVGCADPEPGGSEGTSDPTTQSPTDTDTDTEPTPTTPTTPVTTAPATDVEPPLGETSGGSGGAAHPNGTAMQASGADYILIAPSAATGSGVPLLIVYSGTEGSNVMTYNMLQLAPAYGMGDALVAVLDGRFSSADDGAAVIDALRADYDVDNDRTWLLSESAGTVAGLELGFEVRQSYFAAFWANDVNARGEPRDDAATLGFTPWGNAGPGGDLPDANAIVDAMAAAGYDLPADAPYSGAGAETHGSVEQFLTAVDFFADKSRSSNLRGISKPQVRRSF